jgi:hypothetical protein
MKGVSIDKGDSDKTVLEDVKAPMRFHLETLGTGALETDPPMR